MADKLKLQVAGFVRKQVRDRLVILEADLANGTEAKFQVFTDLRSCITVHTPDQGTRMFEVIVKEVM